MKVRASVKAMCEKCKIIRRHGNRAGHLHQPAASSEAGVVRGAYRGSHIPPQKRVEIGLTYIYGLGRSTANRVLAQLSIDPNTKVRDLTEEEIVRLREFIDASLGRRRPAKGAFAEHQAPDGDRLLRGLRHRRGMLVNGQRTKTNARGRKGPKKTVGARRSKK